MVRVIMVLEGSLTLLDGGPTLGQFDSMTLEAGHKYGFTAGGDGMTFVSQPFERETEITGPSAAHLRVSSSTADADVFLVLRVFTNDLRPRAQNPDWKITPTLIRRGA